MGFRESVAKLVPTPPLPAGVDRSIEGPGGALSVRVYRVAAAGITDAPLVVFFHGGGWVVCDVDTHDAACRRLAAGAGATVVSVDYRLAPEHRYPAAADDCIAATRWAMAHAAELGVDAARTVVSGDSAGGNLAAAVALQPSSSRLPKLWLQQQQPDQATANFSETRAPPPRH
jgi:acetyl esterase